MSNQLHVHSYPSLKAITAAGVMSGLLAYGGITLTHNGSRVAEIWLPNALILAVVLRGRGLGALAYLPAAFGANVVADIFVGDDWLRAIGLSLANSLEIMIVWLALRRLAMSRPDMGKLTDLAVFALLAGLIAPL